MPKHYVLVKENLLATKERCSQDQMHTKTTSQWRCSNWSVWSLKCTAQDLWHSIKVALKWIPLHLPSESDLATRRRECNSNDLHSLSHLSLSKANGERTPKYFISFYNVHVCMHMLREASLQYDFLSIMKMKIPTATSWNFWSTDLVLVCTTWNFLFSIYQRIYWEMAR